MSVLADVGNPIRFTNWYSKYEHIFNNLSTQACNETLNAYVADYRNFDTPTCELHLDCVLGEASESLKAKMASAAIFLGVLPAMLSLLGPSMAQLTILSARRPFLSLLIAVGTTGVYLDRLFRVETPVEVLSIVQGERWVPRIRSSRWGFVVSLIEYVMAAAAVLNVMNMAVRLGDRTIMSFQCTAWFLPLVWVLGLTFICLLAAIPFQFSAVAKHIRNCQGPGGNDESAPNAGSSSADDIQWVPLQDRSSKSATAFAKPVRQNSATRFMLREVTTGLTNPSLTLHDMPEYEPWMVFLLNIGCGLAAFHVILGTCFFSSILFLSPLDAIGIIMRFFGSAVACRLIVMVELASMKAREHL